MAAPSLSGFRRARDPSVLVAGTQDASNSSTQLGYLDQGKPANVLRCMSCALSKVKCDLSSPCARCWRLSRRCVPAAGADHPEEPEPMVLLPLVLDRHDAAPLFEEFLRVLKAALREVPLCFDRAKTLCALQAWDRLSGLVGADVTHGIAAGVRTWLGIAQSDHGKSDGGAGAVAAAADEGAGDDPEQDDEVARLTTTEMELAATMAASETLRATSAFQTRAACEPSAPLLVMNVTGDGPGGGACQRLAVNGAFERDLVGLRELLEVSLRRKTCPLLLLAALFSPMDRETWFAALIEGLFMVDRPSPFSDVVKAVDRQGRIGLYVFRRATFPMPALHAHGVYFCLDTLQRSSHCTNRPDNPFAPVPPSPPRRTPAAGSAAANGGAEAEAPIHCFPGLATMLHPLGLPDERVTAEVEADVAATLFTITSENMQRVLEMHEQEPTPVEEQDSPSPLLKKRAKRRKRAPWSPHLEQRRRREGKRRQKERKRARESAGEDGAIPPWLSLQPTQPQPQPRLPTPTGLGGGAISLHSSFPSLDGLSPGMSMFLRSGVVPVLAREEMGAEGNWAALYAFDDEDEDEAEVEAAVKQEGV